MRHFPYGFQAAVPINRGPVAFAPDLARSKGWARGADVDSKDALSIRHHWIATYKE
jgi:hypothetical protein